MTGLESISPCIFCGTVSGGERSETLDSFHVATIGFQQRILMHVRSRILHSFTLIVINLAVALFFFIHDVFSAGFIASQSMDTQ